MKRQHRFTSQNIIRGVIVLSIIAMIFTWETRTSISPVEQSVSYVIIPFQKGVTVFGGWIEDRISFIQNIGILEDENKTLTDEVSQLRYENQLLKLDRLELERLRELYELDRQYADYPKIGARIIGKDPGNWYEIFIIDKGTRDGIQVNMVVMSGGGLVGRIIEVGANYAKVKSIIDDAASVSGKFLRTSDLCTVSGEKQLGDQGLCLVEYIESDANIKEGDEVVTSHLGSIYPPGILIGRIDSIESDPNKLTKTAVLEPAVDFKHLEEVLVINLLQEELVEVGEE